MLTLYHSPGSSSMAVHIALHEIGAPFESRFISLAGKENRAPDYLALNPEGKVPTLLIDGRPLTEVAAILFYLARRYPEAGLWPEGDLEAEAHVISWMSFIAATIHPARRQGLERSREVFEIAERRVGASALLDRRHPPVPAVLALCWLGAPRTGDVPRACSALRAHDGPPRGAADLRDRSGDRLRAAGVAWALAASGRCELRRDAAESGECGFQAFGNLCCDFVGGAGCRGLPGWHPSARICRGSACRASPVRRGRTGGSCPSPGGRGVRTVSRRR